MFTTSILLATWLTGSPELDLRVSGPSVCPDGTSFDAAMIPHECADPVATIDVRFYQHGDLYCTAVGDSAIGGCYQNCEDALRIAAMRAGEVIDRSCDAESATPAEPADPASFTGQIGPVEFDEPQLPAPPPSQTSLQADLTIATLASAGHLGLIAAGFMSGVGLSENGTQFAMIGGFADITPKEWYWRAGLEVCRGRRDGAWEWNGCLGVGGGEIYTGDQTTSREYPWASLSHSTRIHVARDWGVRLDLGGQVAVADQQLGVRIARQSNFTPFVTLGIQYEIPLQRTN